MNFNTIDITSMIWVLKTLQLTHTQLNQLPTDTQASLVNNLPRIINPPAAVDNYEVMDDYINNKINFMRALKHVIVWEDLPENIQHQLLSTLIQLQHNDMLMVCYELEHLRDLFSAVLDIQGTTHHRHLMIIKTYFLDGLLHAFEDDPQQHQDHFEEPLLECLRLAKTMGIQWQQCPDPLKDKIMRSIIDFTEDHKMLRLESMLIALAQIGVTWSELNAYNLYAMEETTVHELITQVHTEESLERSNYVNALDVDSLDQWIQAFILLGLTATDIAQQSPDLWQRYRSTAQGTMQILNQFNRTWAQKGYYFPNEILKKFGFFAHDAQLPPVAQLLNNLWEESSPFPEASTVA